MSQPTGNCPICNKPLRDNDDIVICPDCGAPYHRECYTHEGHCIYADKHGQGFEYKTEPKNPGDAPPPPGHHSDNNNDTVTCPACGTANPPRNIFCEQCGAPLHGALAGQAGSRPGGFGAGFGSTGVYISPPMMDMSGEIDGIPKTEWATYIGNSAPAYLSRMAQQQQRGSKISIFASAFLLGPFYFAYRKMWGWAAVSGLFWLVTSIPTFLVLMFENGNPLVMGMSEGFISGLFQTASLLNIVARVLYALFALYFYRRTGAKRIKKLQEKYPTKGEEYQKALAKAGGTSVLGVVIVFAVIFVLSGLSYPFIGEDVMAYYNSLM